MVWYWVLFNSNYIEIYHYIPQFQNTPHEFDTWDAKEPLATIYAECNGSSATIIIPEFLRKDMNLIWMWIMP